MRISEALAKMRLLDEVCQPACQFSICVYPNNEYEPTMFARHLLQVRETARERRSNSLPAMLYRGICGAEAQGGSGGRGGSSTARN